MAITFKSKRIAKIKKFIFSIKGISKKGSLAKATKIESLASIKRAIAAKIVVVVLVIKYLRLS